MEYEWSNTDKNGVSPFYKGFVIMFPDFRNIKNGSIISFIRQLLTTLMILNNRLRQNVGIFNEHKFVGVQRYGRGCVR